MAASLSCTRLLCLCLLLPALKAFAQQPALQFDVASIRPAQTPQGRGPLAALREDINTTPGNLTMRNVTVETCIRWAYKLNPYQVSGQDRLATDRYDIIAKAPNSA